MNMTIINELDDKYSLFIHLPNFLNENNILENLNNISNWRYGEYTQQEVNRVQQFFHVNGEPFCKNWKTIPHRWESMTYYPWLIDLQNKLEKDLNKVIEPLYEAYNLRPLNFKSVLINKYRNGSDFIPPHFDTTENINPTIVSLSFGETRTFVVKRILFEQEREYKYELKHGDVFIMGGCSQQNFTHELLKDNTINPRYNLTFR